VPRCLRIWFSWSFNLNINEVIRKWQQNIDFCLILCFGTVHDNWHKETKPRPKASTPQKNYISLTLVYHVRNKSGEKVWNKANSQQWISDGVLKCLKPPIANQEMQLAGGGIFAHDLHVSIVFVVWAKIIWWKETAILFSLYCTSIGHPFGHWVIYHCGYCHYELLEHIY